MRMSFPTATCLCTFVDPVSLLRSKYESRTLHGLKADVLEEPTPSSKMYMPLVQAEYTRTRSLLGRLRQKLKKAAAPMPHRAWLYCRCMMGASHALQGARSSVEADTIKRHWYTPVLCLVDKSRETPTHPRSEPDKPRPVKPDVQTTV